MDQRLVDILRIKGLLKYIIPIIIYIDRQNRLRETYIEQKVKKNVSNIRKHCDTYKSLSRTLTQIIITVSFGFMNIYVFAFIETFFVLRKIIYVIDRDRYSLKSLQKIELFGLQTYI